MGYIFDKFGRRHKIEHLNATIRLEELKKKSGSNPWPVIEECINVWTSTNPTKWDSYLYYLKNIKETRKETSVGGKRFRGVTREDKKNNAILAYTLDIPEPIIFMIRDLYSPDELPMNKEFFREFGARFPKFKILEAN